MVVLFFSAILSTKVWHYKILCYHACVMGTIYNPVLFSVLQTPIFLSHRGGRFIVAYIIFFHGVTIVLRTRIGQISFETDKFDALHCGKIVYSHVSNFIFPPSSDRQPLETDCIEFPIDDVHRDGHRIKRFTLYYILYRVLVSA